MSSQKSLLTPQTVTATYDSFTHQLCIEACGNEEGLAHITIEEVQMSVCEPTFMVTGECTAAIGDFPYTTKAQFNCLNQPECITIRTTEGDKEYPVKATQINATPNFEAQKVGLFLAHYLINTKLMGAPAFNLYLTISTADGNVHGGGNITQATNPPVNIGTKLDGNFTYMTVMPKQTSILVTATGYPAINWSPTLGIAPVLLPNVELRMVLNQDWKSGTANYKYLDCNGNWHSVNNAHVELCGNSVELEAHTQAQKTPSLAD